MPMFTILQYNLGELISSLYVKLLTYFLEEPEKWLLRLCIAFFFFFFFFYLFQLLKSEVMWLHLLQEAGLWSSV